MNVSENIISRQQKGTVMTRTNSILILLILGASTALILLSPPSEAKALPEYSAQTGEPCATCHLSPSGGGPRGPRGQGWVGSGKPSVVPSLVDSLDLLGVELDVDPADFQASGEPVEPAQPLIVDSEQAEEIHDWLKEFNGN